MVRDAARRITKYTAKIVGDVVKNRIDALKDSMVEQVTDMFPLLATMETQVATKCDAWGVHSIQKPFYMSYGRRLFGIKRKHSNLVAIEEACIATHAFIERGLDAYYLMVIADDIFELDVSACTA